MTTLEKTNLNEEMKICWGNNFLTLLGFKSIQQWIKWNIVWAHHKICTPMTMSISNRLYMHDLYLVKLQTYLFYLFLLSQISFPPIIIISFKLNFPYFTIYNVLIDVNKTWIFKNIQYYTVLHKIVFY